MLRLIVIVVLLAHGIGHSMGVMAAWTTIPSGLTSGNWILSGDVTMTSTLGRLYSLLWILALFGFVGTSLGLIMNQDWWRPMAIASAVISLIAIVPWLNIMPTGSAVGAVVVDILVLAGLLSPWADDIVHAVR